MKLFSFHSHSFENNLFLFQIENVNKTSINEFSQQSCFKYSLYVIKINAILPCFDFMSMLVQHILFVIVIHVVSDLGLLCLSWIRYKTSATSFRSKTPLLLVFVFSVTWFGRYEIYSCFLLSLWPTFWSCIEFILMKSILVFCYLSDLHLDHVSNSFLLLSEHYCYLDIFLTLLTLTLSADWTK